MLGCFSSTISRKRQLDTQAVKSKNFLIIWYAPRTPPKHFRETESLKYY